MRISLVEGYTYLVRLRDVFDPQGHAHVMCRIVSIEHPIEAVCVEPVESPARVGGSLVSRDLVDFGDVLSGPYK